MRQLQKLDLGPVNTAADAWGTLTTDLETGQHTVDRQIVAPLRGNWQGKDAEAAFGRLGRLSQNFEYGMADAGDVRTLLAALSAELAPQQTALRQALDQAAALGFTVADDGRVGYPAQDPMMPGTAGPGGGPSYIPGVNGPTSNRDKAQAIADQIRRAVTQAAAIDEKYAAALNKLATTADLQVTDNTWKNIRDATRLTATLADPALHLHLPDTTDPKKIKSWWNGLTPAQRQEYLAAHPDKIGALNGLPSDIRDQANRVVLRESHAAIQQQLAGMPPEPPRYLHGGKAVVENPAWQAWHNQRDLLTGQLKGMDAIQQHLDTAGQNGRPDGYLLGIDTNGKGHAIVANGNPDTAHHVAVYVPGTYAKLDHVGGDFSRIDNLWWEANKLTPGQVSTIAWFGYDAPDNIVTESPFRSYADNAAPLLDQFNGGLTVAHQGDPAHMTMIGHSYGSTVIGSAAIHGHLGANDILVAGSPGMEVSSASDLGVGSDHFYVEKAWNDPVPLGGTLTELPGHSWAQGFIPTIPGDRPFGGTNLPVDTSGHSGYWDQGSQSLRNQALVITGKANHG